MKYRKLTSNLYICTKIIMGNLKFSQRQRNRKPNSLRLVAGILAVHRVTSVNMNHLHVRMSGGGGGRGIERGGEGG